VTAWVEPERPGVDHADAVANRAQAAPRSDLVAPATCEIGAHCRLSLRIDCPADARCAFDPPGRLGPFEVTQVSEAPQQGDTRIREWHLTLVAFEPGPVDLPQLAIRVVDAAGSAQVVHAPPARIDVVLVAAPTDAALRPDAAPFDPGPDVRVVAAVALGLALTIALGFAAWRAWHRRARRRPPPPPPVSAESAIAAIRALAAAPARTPDATLAAYRGLSDALRGYLGLPLDVPAIALTSTEILSAIDDVRRRGRERAAGSPDTSAAVDPAAVDCHERTRTLLVHVDGVKFGGARPADPVRADASQRAVALIEELEQTRLSTQEGSGDVA
jgi:hypothetical protein